LRRMNKSKTSVLHTLVQSLDRDLTALGFAELSQNELEEQRSALLQENAGLDRELKDLTEPGLTDLDLDLMMSLRGGLERTSQVLIGAEVRWFNLRERVIGQWHKYEEAQRSATRTSQLHSKIDRLHAAHREQQKVLERATKQSAEVEQLRGTIDHQKQMVRNLQQRIKEAKNRGGARVELEFALSKERSEHESLLEVATQLELRARQHSRSRPVTDTQARLLRHSAEKAEMLAAEIDRLQSQPVQGNVLELAQQVAERQASTQQAIEVLNDRLEELNLQEETVKQTSEAHARSLAQQRLALFVELAERDATCARLEELQSTLA